MKYFESRSIATVCLMALLFLVNETYAGESADNSNESVKWGLGAAVGIINKPYTNYGTDFLALPVLLLDSKWVRIAGPGIDLKLGKVDDFSFAIHTKFGFDDGYKASDASILSGMAERKGGIWIGPSVTWSTQLGKVSAKILADASGNSKGTQASIEASKPYKYGNFEFVPRLGISWMSAKYVDYYYGVEANEARFGRSEYAGASTVNLIAGIRTDYDITRNQTLMLDVGITALGSGVTDSSLVDTSTASEVRMAYIYRF